MRNEEETKRLNEITLSRFHEVCNVETLKSYGSFHEVKAYICKKSCLSLNCREWESLCYQIEKLAFSVEQNSSKLNILINKENGLKSLGNFKEAKEKLSKMLTFKVKARGWNALHQKLVKILQAFSKDKLDRYGFYEKNKKTNFINSSKLENIHIKNSHSKRTIADIRKKYMVSVNG